MHGLRLPRRWLTPRRIRAQAIVLALCLWGVCAVDFATPGTVRPRRQHQVSGFPSVLHLRSSDRAGPRRRTLRPTAWLDLPKQCARSSAANSACACPISTDRKSRLLVRPAGALLISCRRANLGRAQPAHLLSPASIWSGNRVQRCARTPRIVALCAIAFPPLFHFFVRGQISALVLACFTAAFLAFRARSRLARRNCAGIPRLQAAVSGCDSAGAAAGASLEGIRRARRSPRARSWLSQRSISAPR